MSRRLVPGVFGGSRRGARGLCGAPRRPRPGHGPEPPRRGLLLPPPPPSRSLVGSARSGSGALGLAAGPQGGGAFPPGRPPSDTPAPPPAPGLDLLSLPELFPPRGPLATIIPPVLNYEETVVSRNPVSQIKSLSPSQIEEQIGIIGACMGTGELARAVRIFNQLWARNPMSLAKITTTRLLNAFIDQMVSLTPPDMASALQWYQMFPEYASRGSNVHRDLHTYELMLKGYLRRRDMDSIRAMVAAMGKEPRPGSLPNASKWSSGDAGGAVLEPEPSEGYTVTDLLQFIRARDSELAEELADVFRALGHTIKDVRSADAVFRDLGIDIDALTEESEVSLNDQASLNESNTDINPILEATLHPLEYEFPTIASMGSDSMMSLSTILKALESTNKTPYEQQKDLETDSYQMALQELQEFRKSRHLMSAATVPGKLVLDWHEKLHPLIAQEQRQCAQEAKSLAPSRSERATYGPFLSLLSAEQMSLITITETLRGWRAHAAGVMGKDVTTSRTNGVKVAVIFRAIGAACETEYNLSQVRAKQNKAVLRKEFGIWELHAPSKLFSTRMKHMAKFLEAEKERFDTDWTPMWGETALIKIGSLLTQLLLRVATIPCEWDDPVTSTGVTTSIPAFHHGWVVERSKRFGTIEYAQPLVDLLAKEPVKAALNPRLLPMLVHPRPWTKWNTGGYLETPSTCIRTKHNREHTAYIQDADDKGHLGPILDSLNVLGSVGWKINQKVLSVVVEIWNGGANFPGIPGVEKPPKPTPPDDFATNIKAKVFHYHALRTWERDVYNLYSRRCDVNIKVDIAKAYARRTFYFPHNMDFRGRTYPIPPNLNHLGNDLTRGMLLFADKRPLGPRGLQWLKIHLSNVYGFDKASFRDRIDFVNNAWLSGDIKDSVMDPLSGKRWWCKASDPWQCLAACWELYSAYQLEDPTTYESSLPIHQDGSCNGLQHYAALGRDLKGASQVNLVPGERPMDVYMGVKDELQKLVDADALKGVPEAILIKDRITRKLVKQPVMTTTYGVTFVGARKQIYTRLAEQRLASTLSDEPNSAAPLTNTELWRCSHYIAERLMTCLSSLFEGATKIQFWLTECASAVSKSYRPATSQDDELEGGIPMKELELAKWLHSKGLIQFTLWEPGSEPGSEVPQAAEPSAEGAASSGTEDAGAPLSATLQSEGRTQAGVAAQSRESPAAAAQATLLSSAETSSPDATSPSPSPAKSSAHAMLMDMERYDVTDEDNDYDFELPASSALEHDAHGLAIHPPVQTELTIKQISETARAVAAPLAEAAATPDPKQVLTGSAAVKRASERNTTVVWTTPLGLPIAQPYRVMGVRQIKTHMQTVSIPDDKRAGPVNSRKQAAAFPPNFIHSLDASHMMLSAITSHKHGLTFAAVHDSYWTHARDIDKMNDILRQCFVKLHSENILARLRAEFEGRYRNYKLPCRVAIPRQLEAEYLAVCARLGIRATVRRGPAGEEDAQAAKTEAAKTEAAEAGAAETGAAEAGAAEAGAAEAGAAEAGAAEAGAAETGAVEAGAAEVGAAKAGTAEAGAAKAGQVPPSLRALGRSARIINSWTDIVLPPLPPSGDLDIDAVRDSPYFFH